MIKFPQARIRRTGRRHASPNRAALSAGGGTMRSIGAAVRLHPIGFGAPAAVIAAAVAYLVIAGPVSIRLGHPGPAASHSPAAAQAPSSAGPSGTVKPGDPASRARQGGVGGPVSGYVPSGSAPNAAAGTAGGTAAGTAAGTGGGRGQPSAAPGTPASAGSPAAPAPGSSPGAPAPPGSHSSCLDLDVLSVCL